MIMPFILSASIADPAFAVPEQAGQTLRNAENLGIDLLVFGRPGERPFDAQVLVAWAAARTRRMGLIATVPAGNAHPFHVARALSAVDFLAAGRCGWSVTPEGAPAGMAEDMIGAARALWDGWDSDTLIIDKASGRYLDAAKVRASNYKGAFFKVAGPVNAMRPPLGQPVLVIDDAERLAIDDADIALVTTPEGSPPATRMLLKVALDSAPETLRAHLDAGKIDGFHFTLDDPLADLAAIGDRFGDLIAARPVSTGDLRHRLRLPLPETASNQRDGAHVPEYAA